MAKACIKIDREACKGCWLCIHVCPKKTIVKAKMLNAKGYYPAEPEEQSQCTGCESCMIVCPEMAIEVYDVED